jgi:hypothetical protein
LTGKPLIIEEFGKAIPAAKLSEKINGTTLMDGGLEKGESVDGGNTIVYWCSPHHSLHCVPPELAAALTLLIVNHPPPHSGPVLGACYVTVPLHHYIVTGARHVIHHMVHRCSDATSSTALYFPPRHPRSTTP